MKAKGKNSRTVTTNGNSNKGSIATAKDITVRLVKLSPKVYKDNRVAAYVRIVP